MGLQKNGHATHSAGPGEVIQETGVRVPHWLIENSRGTEAHRAIDGQIVYNTSVLPNYEQMFNVAVDLASVPHITDLQLHDEYHTKQQATVLEE